MVYPPSKSGNAEPCLAEIIFVPGFGIPTDESWAIIRCGRSSLWPQSLLKNPEFQQTRLWMFEYEFPSRMLGQSGMGLDELAGNLTYWLGIELEEKGHVRHSMHLCKLRVGTDHISGVWDGRLVGQTGMLRMTSLT